jgi:hypothetical protein
MAIIVGSLVTYKGTTWTVREIKAAALATQPGPDVDSPRRELRLSTDPSLPGTWVREGNVIEQ